MRFLLAFLSLLGCGDLRVVHEWDDVDLAFLVVDGETRGPFVGRPKIDLAVKPWSEVGLIEWSRAMLDSQNAFYDPEALAEAGLVMAPCLRGFDEARSNIPASDGLFLAFRKDRFVEETNNLGELSLSLPIRRPSAALRAVAQREQLVDDGVALDKTELRHAVRVSNFVAALAREALYLVASGEPYLPSDRTLLTEIGLRSLVSLPFVRMAFVDVEVESEASVLLAVRERDVAAPRGAIVRARISEAGFDGFEVVVLFDQPLRAFARAPDGRTLALIGPQSVLSATTAAGPYVEGDVGFEPKDVVYSGESAQPFLLWGDSSGVAIGDVGSFFQLGPVQHTGDLNGVARVDEGGAVYYAADSTGALFRSTGGRWDLLALQFDPAVRACAGVDACGIPSVTRWQSLSASRRNGRTRLLAIPAMCNLLMSIDPETGIAEALTGSEVLMLETGLGLYAVTVDEEAALVFGGEARLLRLDL